MKKLTALLAGMTLAMTALPAAAGVVITQKVHMTNGTNSRDSEQTISLQGNKQKLVDERHTIILDLDKGMLYALDPKAKTYFEIEFPAKGPQAAMMAEAGMGFKKAATTHEIADYRCTDYDGSVHVMAGDFLIPSDFTKRDLPAPDSMKMSPGTMKMAPPLGGPNAGASPAAP